MPAQFLHFAAGAALYDPAEVSPGELSELLEDGLKHRSQPLNGSAGREGVRIIHRARRPWVWRHNRRGGWPGRLIHDSYVWLGAARTRSFREWRLLHHLRQVGLPVPPPIAALYERRGLIYRSDIITGLIPGAETLGAKLKLAPLPLEVWRQVGTCIRRFHEHGIDHADLNVHNILLDERNDVFLIDFDRGVVREPGGWAAGNWTRLRRSLDKLVRRLPPGRFGEEEWRTLRVG